MPKACSSYCQRMCETRQNAGYTVYENEKWDMFEFNVHGSVHRNNILLYNSN